MKAWILPAFCIGITAWAQSPDVTGDGFVDSDDLLEVLTLWHQSVGEATQTPTALPTPSATPTAIPGRSIEFANYQWLVRGDMPFSASEENVHVDSMGVHLSINQIAGVWRSAEISLIDQQGYGVYQFRTQGAVHELNPSVIFSGVLSDEHIPSASETGFVWSRFGDQFNPNVFATLGGYCSLCVGCLACSAYSVVSVTPEQELTHVLYYLPTGVAYWLYGGHYDDSAPADVPLWLVEERIGARPALVDERFHLRLSLLGGAPLSPAGGFSVHVTDFKFYPLVQNPP